MSKVYTLTGSLRTGHLKASDYLEPAWTNFLNWNEESSNRGYAGLDTGYWYYATNILFDQTTLTSLRTKVSNGATATVTLTVYCSKEMTGETLIAYKYNSTVYGDGNSKAWARCHNDGTSGADAASVAYLIPAQTLTTGYKTFTLKGTADGIPYAGIPQYGLVAGPQTNVNGRWRFTSATLTVTTNEVTISYSKGTATGASGNNYSDVIIPGSTLRGSGYYSRTGYTQDGWSVNANGSTKDYNLSSPYSGTADLTLYPHWKADTYTIKYDANGGSGAPGNQTKTYGVDLTLSSTKPTRANASAGSYTVTYNANSGSVSPDSASAARTTSYTFNNWNTASGGGGTSYSSGGTYSANAAATLYAQWNSSTTTAAVTLPTPTRSGYTCNGWYTAASGGTKVANAGASYTPTGNITLYAQWAANVVAPTFTTQPASKSVYRGASTSLSVVATTSQGTITYQWQSSSNNSDWSNISGATSASYTTPTSTVGTVYYRCVATATKDGVSKSTNSNSASVVVSATPTPSISTQPTSKSVNVAGTASLSVAATSASGTLSYQWYSSTDNSTFNAISDATSTSYSATTSSPGTKYYKVRVTNTLNGYTAYTDSSSVSVVVSVAAPTITTHPSSLTVKRGATATLSVAATAPYGTLSYQWQSSSSNSSFSNITGATSASYTAPTSSTGVVYYRCVVKATYSGTSSGNTYSNSASVSTDATPAPVITANPSNKSVITGTTGQTISVTATGNSLSYQWQSLTNNSAWSNVSGATSSSYSFPTSSAGTVYYRCVVTNTLNGYTATATSTVATVVVSNLTGPTFTSQPVSANYAIGGTAVALSVSATSNGTVTYQWQSSNDDSTWSNISGATSANYTPPTNTAGVKYYRCVATATGGSQSNTANSSSASITVIQATAPVFAYDLSQIDVTYNAGDISNALNGTATATNGTINYQWYKSTDSGSTWFPIAGATSATYSPATTEGGTAYYRVIATNIVGTSSASTTSNAAKVTVQNVILDYDAKWSQYINSVGKPFVKLARLDFLNPNGSVLYTLDNNPLNSKSGAFIQSGELTVNLQNGMRRTATVTLSNLDGEFDYNVNKLWFGQQVRLWEGMILPSGADFYISQGVFYVKDPNEVFEPGLKQTTLNLVDKWAYLDGTLFGNLDGTYEVPLNSNIFNAIQSVLDLDRGNGQKVDSSPPVFTNYYNGKTTTLPDGTTVPLTNTPYTYRCDGEEGTYADIILEMNTMLAGWIGYDANGQLRLDPSQDDILDTTKPVQWQFSPNNSTFLGATYTVKNSEVYNDIIIVGESLSKYGQTAGRATNYDPKSDTNVNIIGLKTKRYQQSGYYTQDICESLATFKLKRESVLKKSVSIKCSQMFHLQENNLVTIERTDKYGNPIERHLITGYTRPIAQNGEMVLNCTSANDYPVATITTAP